ncbi:MAG TPA: alpha-ketoglutarate-dependent dioxygenase AlkB [Candidatus Koribacter sp.]
MPARTTPLSELPEGFAYQAEFLSHDEEGDLLVAIGKQEFQPVNFQGYIARRRIVSYGFDYDFGSRQTTATAPIPEFLSRVRERAAVWAGVRAEELQEAIVTEYRAGAPIGWHRDAPQFEAILGISFAGTCRMRFKPFKKEGKSLSASLEPRSIYALRGLVRWHYQHSIPAVPELRYSITFRTLRERTRKSRQ